MSKCAEVLVHEGRRFAYGYYADGRKACCWPVEILETPEHLRAEANGREYVSICSPSPVGAAGLRHESIRLELLRKNAAGRKTLTAILAWGERNMRMLDCMYAIAKAQEAF